MASSSRPQKRKLSKNLLQMKFMKRSKEKEERDAEKEDERLVLGPQGNGGVVYTEPSVCVAGGLRFGRLSFQGMNPEIERMMEERSEEANDMDKDVSDASMADTMRSNFVGKKAVKRRQNEDQDKNNESDNSNKKKNKAWKPKRKFLRPKKDF